MSDDFLAILNLCVPKVFEIPRVRFDAGVGEGGVRWITKKHAGVDRHEPGTIAAIMAVLDEEFPVNRYPRFFDCGALYGYFSLVMAQFRSEAQIVAFDMHPAVIEPLLRNLPLDSTVVHGALSDECREDVNIWISGFNIFTEPAGGWEEFARDEQAMKPRGPDNRGAGYAKVDFITLDAYAEQYGPPDFIKIDVEGFQAKAIAGAANILRTKRPPVIIELHDPEKLQRFGTTNAATVQPLFELGYRAYWCGNHRDRNAEFEPVLRMTERQEKLSLMVFMP